MRASTPIVMMLATLFASPTFAQTPAEFYRGKSIDLFVWTSAGGAYDAYARALARHMSRFIPGGPALAVKSMEGAGGLRLSNHLFNVAPKDGLAFGTISRGNAFDPLLGNKIAQFDGRQFNWIGSTNNEISVCVSWHTSGVATFKDAMTRDLVVGASGPTADSYQFPKLINAVLGTKFKIVSGYAGGNEIDLAMERGEVQGRCSWSWTSLKGLHQRWLDERKLNILYQMGLSKHPDLPDTPLAIDLATNDETKSILKLVFARQVLAWPFVAPPGVPTDRVAALRKAFADTLRDQDFLADAAKQGLEVTPVSGEEIQTLVHDVYATPEAITRKVAELIR
jgi:tripartite-type tricarboxylate transporter receptor subunit TctC